MLNRLFPRQFDNTYSGFTIAIWLFSLIVLIKFLMAVNVTGLNPWISTRYIIEDVDGIPLDTFSVEAASVVVFLFACWGLLLLMLSSLCMLVFFRYRAMIPLMYLLLSIEQVGRTGLSVINPFFKTLRADGISSGTVINASLTAALVIGLVLSLAVSRKEDRENAP